MQEERQELLTKLRKVQSGQAAAHQPAPPPAELQHADRGDPGRLPADAAQHELPGPFVPPAPALPQLSPQAEDLRSEARDQGAAAGAEAAITDADAAIVTTPDRDVAASLGHEAPGSLAAEPVAEGDCQLSQAVAAPEIAAEAAPQLPTPAAEPLSEPMEGLDRPWQPPGALSPSRRISVAAAGRLAATKAPVTTESLNQVALSPSFQLLLPRRMFDADADGSAAAAVGTRLFSTLISL